jgi:hypothetical protein
MVISLIAADLIVGLWPATGDRNWREPLANRSLTTCLSCFTNTRQSLFDKSISHTIDLRARIQSAVGHQLWGSCLRQGLRLLCNGSASRRPMLVCFGKQIKEARAALPHRHHHLRS